MRFPVFNKESVRWDRYKEFHVGVTKSSQVATDHWVYPPFIAFENGEVVSTNFNWNPDDRGYNTALEVSVYLTSDEQMPQLYMRDGTPVKKAWYDNCGHQYLILDHATGRVVCHHGDVELPPHRENFRVFWAKEGEPPVGAPVIICRPDKLAMTKEQQQYKDDWIASTRAAMTLVDHPAVNAKGWYGRMDTLPVSRIFEVDSWDKLEEWELRCFYHRGVGRFVLKEPYLLMEQP